VVELDDLRSATNHGLRRLTTTLIFHLSFPDGRKHVCSVWGTERQRHNNVTIIMTGPQSSPE